MAEAGIESSGPQPWFAEPCIVGVDEAGRGPVLGPMVYGVCACPCAFETELKSKKYADSKTLTEEKRSALSAQVKAEPRMAWAVNSLSAEYLSTSMLQRGRVSLNEIAAQATFSLIRLFQEQGMNVHKVFVDTVGDAGRYQERLSREFPGVQFTVCPKADALYPIVSAASIVAKVTRDAQLHASSLGPDGQPLYSSGLGSGYPGDPETKAWLESNVDRVFGFPPLVRFSWQTTTTILAARGVPVVFEADSEEDSSQQTLCFGKRAAELELSCAADRHSFFRARRIQRCTAL